MKKNLSTFIKPISIKEMAYQNIKKQIIKRNFKPGSWLKEEELAGAMGISRAPIREAFNQLERDGFIVFMPRKGARVTPFSIKEVEDIFEIRENLELLALKKSYVKIPLKQLNYLASRFKQFQLYPIDESNIHKYLSLDKVFHDLLIDYCDNRMLIKFLYNIKEKIHWLRGFSLDRHSFLQSVEEHLAIIKAIQDQDKNLMSNCLIKHLTRAKESIVKEIKMEQIENQ